MPSNKFGNEYRDIRSLSKFGYNSTIKSGDVIDLDTYVTTVVSSSTSGDVSSSVATSTDNTIVRMDGTTGKAVQGSGVVINDSNEITNIAKLTSVELHTNNYKDGIGHSGLFMTAGANGVVQMTKDTYKGTQDALLSLHTDGTIQKSNIVSSDVATIDDSSTSASTTWSSSKVSAEISAGGGGGNTLVADLSAETPNDYLTSGLNGSSIGVANQLFYGKYYTFKSATTMSAGRVVSFNNITNMTGELEVTYVNGNIGEENAASQAIGVTLNDCVAGGTVNVATSGICSVLCGSTTTAQRGCMITVGGSASSYQGKVVCTSRTANEPSVGICMSYGSRANNQPIVVWLQTGFESY